MWSSGDGPFTLARDGLFDITNYSHHTFGFRDNAPHAPFPFGCHDQPVPGASGEVSCIWDAMFACVGAPQHSTRESLHFQACLEYGWSPFTGPVYTPYAWLTPSHSTAGHAPYQVSNYTSHCVATTTTIAPAAFAQCLGLADGRDAFIGSRGHALLMAEYAYSERTFKAANLTQAGPTIFVEGKHRADLDGACWDGSVFGGLPAKCKWRLLDAVCEAARANGYDALPKGCAHDE